MKLEGGARSGTKCDRFPKDPVETASRNRKRATAMITSQRSHAINFRSAFSTQKSRSLGKP